MSGSRRNAIILRVPGESLSPAELTYRSRRRTWLVFLVLVIVLAILQLAAMGGVAVLLVMRGLEKARGLPLTDQDRSVLVRISDLVENSAETEETLRKWHGRGHALHLRSLGHADGERGAVRVYCEVVITNDPDDASRQFHYLEMSLADQRHIDRYGELVPTARSELFIWGEESMLYTFERDGRPAGIRFLARREGTVFLLAISGRKLNDPQLLDMLISPVLRKVEQYQ